MKVRVTKVSSKVPSSPGHFDNEDWREGTALNEPVVGQPFWIHSITGGSNGRSSPLEAFHTSAVTAINELKSIPRRTRITTRNSVWEITYLS